MITLTGTYGKANETAPAGYVDIQPMVTAALATTIITQAPVRATLDSEGAISTEIVASDDGDWANGPIPYIFREFIDGQVAQWMAYVNGPGPVDISDLVPLTEAPSFPSNANPDDYLRKDQADVPNGYLPIRPDGRVGDVIFTGIQTATTWPVDTDGPELATLDFVHAQIAADVPSFDYNKTTDILGIPNTWTEINRLEIDRPAGVYLFALSITWRFDVTNRSALFRFSTDGGQTWRPEYIVEPGDTSDRLPLFYSFPVEHAGGPRSVIMQASKTAAQGTLDVTYCDLWYQRVA